MRSFSVFLLAFAFVAMFSTNVIAENFIIGTVTLDQHPAKALVAAVHYDPASQTLDSDHPAVGLTDRRGRFELSPPPRPYLLVATDGTNSAIIDAATTSNTDLVLQGWPDMVMPASTVRCYCSRLFWNFYQNEYWESTGMRWHTITWGCGCNR